LSSLNTGDNYSRTSLLQTNNN